ncbi:MAG: ABC-2 transporter permease [Bacteroidales bacterium]|nr:ABC-2 transporter permease [Bacteroidales bacterium]MCM1415329.1 ABC-2 transporter permease [bacterium]MCM1424030.1 ABC-2 transporter permease [bacterium]
MVGLLYKDFVAVDRIGKVRLTLLLAGLTILYIALRMAFPGMAESGGLLVEIEGGEPVSLADALFFSAFGLFLVGTMALMNGWTARIVEMDDRNQIRGYLDALPLGKRAYAASKYLFLAIAAYILMSLSYVWYLACLAFCREGMLEDAVLAVGSLIPSLAGLSLFLAAVELPLYLLFGKERAVQSKTACIMLLALALIGFLLFGDLAWLERHLNLAVFAAWCKKHRVEVLLFSALLPVITLGCYYVSYRITCYFLERKESA